MAKVGGDLLVSHQATLLEWDAICECPDVPDQNLSPPWRTSADPGFLSDAKANGHAASALATVSRGIPCMESRGHGRGGLTARQGRQ